MGIAAIVLGALAIIFGLIPLMSWLAWILLIIGLVLGIIQLVKSAKAKENTAVPIIGTVLCVIAIVVCIVRVAITAQVVSDAFTSAFTSGNVTYTTTSSTSTTPTVATNTSNKHALGDTFVFDGFEITTGTEISWGVVENRFSENNGKSVIKVPVTLVNKNDKTGSLNSFYVDFFGSQGTELDTVDSYFDDSIFDYKDMRSGASKSGYFCLLYDGDGTYGIDFDNWSSKTSIEFTVTK